MSKRNGYEIIVSDTEEVREIVEAIENTGIPVEVKGEDDDSMMIILAEDAPTAGEGFIDGDKDPKRYIYWDEIKQALKPYTNIIKSVQHTFSDDTGCFTKITGYSVEDGEFVQETQTKENYVR